MPTEVQLTRLGRAAPSSRGPLGDGAVSFDAVSSAPIVLWSTHGAPAVLTESVKVAGVYMVGGTIKQTIEVLSGGARELKHRGSPFPIVLRELETQQHEPELIKRVHAADLDGDGEDELIAVYGIGSEGPGTIEVYGAKKRLAEWKGSGRHHRHMLKSIQIARIGGKDVAHAVMERYDDRDEDRKEHRAERNVVLRIDERGVHEVKLTGFGFELDQIGGVGAISRPGSGKLDELVAVVEKKGDREREEIAVYFSRHAPDGSILDAPRRTEGSAYHGNAVHFLPGSDTAVTLDVQNHQLYVVTPRAPKGWVRHADLEERLPDGKRSWLVGVLDPGGEPKIVTACEGELFAEDLQGRFLVRSAEGWRPVAKPEPFFKAKAPRDGQGFEEIILARDGSVLLLVHARRRSIKELSNEETVAAARRFLTDEAFRKIEDEEKLDPTDSLTARWIDEERQERGIKTPIRTIAEWKKALPEHYERSRKEHEWKFHRSLQDELTEPLRYGGDTDRKTIRDPAGYAAWLAGLDLLAETTFTILRDGLPAEQVTIPGAPFVAKDGPEPVADQIHFQAAKRGGTIVLAMSNGEEIDDPLTRRSSKRPERLKLERGFYQLDWRPAGDAR